VNDTLTRIRQLVASDDYRFSQHADDRRRDAGLSQQEIIAGLTTAEVIETYPDYPKGPCILVLQWDADRLPLHLLWGVPSGSGRPAVLITVYRPDRHRWSHDWKRRQ
jgi:hypothetical protein